MNELTKLAYFIMIAQSMTDQLDQMSLYVRVFTSFNFGEVSEKSLHHFLSQLAVKDIDFLKFNSEFSKRIAVPIIPEV